MIPPKVKLFCHHNLLYPLHVPTLAIAFPAPIPPANHAARSSLPPSPLFLSFFESPLSDLSPRTLHLPRPPSLFARSTTRSRMDVMARASLARRRVTAAGGGLGVAGGKRCCGGRPWARRVRGGHPLLLPSPSMCAPLIRSPHMPPPSSPSLPLDVRLA